VFSCCKNILFYKAPFGASAPVQVGSSRTFFSNKTSPYEKSSNKMYELLCASVRKTGGSTVPLIATQNQPEKIKGLFIKTIKALSKREYYSEVQEKPIVQNCGDAIAILRTYGELESIPDNHLAPIIPFCAEDTKDSEESSSVRLFVQMIYCLRMVVAMGNICFAF